MVKAATALMVAAVLMASPAQAQWTYMKGDDNPFQGGQVHIALGLGSGFSLGFRCTNANDLTLIYVTPERVDPKLLSAIKLVPVELRIIVDDEKVRNIGAELGTTPDGENYRLEATDSGVDVLSERIASAKRRIAVAAYGIGKLIWTSTIPAQGSRRALTTLTEKCGIKPATN
jgi:hypothetical protein